MNTSPEEPIAYRLEHLHRALADDPGIGETDVVLEVCGDSLVVDAHVPTDERRDALLAAVRASWPGVVTDGIEVLTHLDDQNRSPG
jgi:hypothetical protein